MYTKGINPIRFIFLKPKMAWFFYVTFGFRVLYSKIFHKKLRLKFYAGKIVKNQDQGNEILKKAIIDGKPFFFGRNGSTELSIVTDVLLTEYGIANRLKNIKADDSRALCNGVFPANKDIFTRFAHDLLEANANIDLYGTFRMILEEYYISNFMPHNVILTHLNMMDFWRYEEPFTYALKGKKVLVIHPLAELIENQYKSNRTKLFSNPKVLPEFQLVTIKAVQSIAGSTNVGYSDWFEAIESMKKAIDNVDFEIAILGCGAYGMSLASYIKQTGKVAIYMGGVTQMLFGIKGKRWDLDPIASKLYNEYWTSVPQKDIPQKSRLVEGGCYW